MLDVHRKIKWTGISVGTVTTIINGFIYGGDLVAIVQAAGVVFSGGVVTAISMIGRSAIKRMVKRVGVRKAAIW